MNRHEGITCIVCKKTNICGPRYKCLRCYNFDLCCICYYQRVASNQHTPDHPMQCIIPRADFALYYGGEPAARGYKVQSYTCPYCGRMGFTNSTLRDHAMTDHSNTTFPVLCPVCAAKSSFGADIATDDLTGHLCSAHRHVNVRLSAESLVPRTSLSSISEDSEAPFDNVWSPEHQDGSVRTLYTHFNRSEDRIGGIPASLISEHPPQLSGSPSPSWSSITANATPSGSNYMLDSFLTEPSLIQNEEPEFDHDQYVDSLFEPLDHYPNENLE